MSHGAWVDGDDRACGVWKQCAAAPARALCETEQQAARQCSDGLSRRRRFFGDEFLYRVRFLRTSAPYYSRFVGLTSAIRSTPRAVPADRTCRPPSVLHQPGRNRPVSPNASSRWRPYPGHHQYRAPTDRKSVHWPWPTSLRNNGMVPNNSILSGR